MFIVDELTGDIIIRQGDNGEYTINNTPTDKIYNAFLSVVDENRNLIGDIETTTNAEGYTTFIITPEFSDKLVVKRGEEEATYYFVVKLCYGVNNIEDTLILGNKGINELNKITVYPKISEGTR